MALTNEELAELAELEREEKAATEAAQDAILRQRLEAKRTRKRLAAKHGLHGRDFVVLETTAGINFAFRRPMDVELDALDEHAEGEERSALERFLLAIALEPSKEILGRALADYPGIGPSFAPAIRSMTGRVREEEEKK